MATLIQETHSCGSRRRCDARCYNATGKKCTCICGGRNHGVGLKKAIENTREIVEELLARDQEIAVKVDASVFRQGVSQDVLPVG